MDDLPYFDIDKALKTPTAKTGDWVLGFSNQFEIATKDLAELSQPDAQFFGIHASNHGRVVIFAGGLPLKRSGKVVGAVGVSGGMGKEDQAVAEAAAAAL